jgi:hypothetical protein
LQLFGGTAVVEVIFQEDSFHFLPINSGEILSISYSFVHFFTVLLFVTYAPKWGLDVRDNL